MTRAFSEEDEDLLGRGTPSDLFSAMVEAWDGLIYVGTADFRILYLNRSFIALLGRDATGEFCYRALHGRDEPCPWCVREVFQGQKVRGRFQNPKNGLWYDVLNSPLPLDDGSFAKVAFIREDSQTQPVIKKLPVFRNLVDRLNDAIFFLAPEDGRVLYANETACRNLGHTRNELLTLRTVDFSEAVSSEEAWRNLVRRIEEEGRVLLDTRHRRRDGTFFPVEVNASAAQAGLQRVIVAVVRDISERHRLERSREEVFSVVSHEMRTPLTAVRGFAEYMLKSGVSPEDRRQFLALIVKESDRLQALIDNLLSFQRLRAGFGMDDPGPVEIPSLLNDVTENFRSPLCRRCIEIECAPDHPPVFGEGEKIRLALQNLVGNAIKYSPPESRIILGAQFQEDFSLIWVRDEGPGIPAEEQEKIFERFYRMGTRQRSSGTGLGLALVREVALAHGGRAWVDSAPEKGAVFYLSLPLASAVHGGGRSK